MLGLLFKILVLPLLLLVLLAGGGLAYLILTPIDQGNVQSRIWQSCMAASGARTVLGAGSSTHQRGFSSGQCTCIGETLVSQMGVSVAATGAEAVRGFLKEGVQSWMAGGNYRSVQNSPRGQMAEAFVATATRLARPCLGN